MLGQLWQVATQVFTQVAPWRQDGSLQVPFGVQAHALGQASICEQFGYVAG